MNKQIKSILIGGLGTLIISLSLFTGTKNQNELIASSEIGLNNKKIEWGIKRNDNHMQPDLGKKNKELIEKYKSCIFYYCSLC